MKHLTTEDVAARLGVTPSTVRAYHSRGQMPPPSGRIGRTPYWTPRDIEPWLEGRAKTEENVVSDVEPFSERARAKQAELAEKESRGEKMKWVDMLGILEPNPDLPDCPSEEIDSGATCELPHHHEGPHAARIEW